MVGLFGWFQYSYNYIHYGIIQPILKVLMVAWLRLPGELENESLVTRACLACKCLISVNISFRQEKGDWR